MEMNLSASRAARRFLDDRVRSDWDWPIVPPCWSASDEEIRDVKEFRERFYGSSSSSGTEDESRGSADPYKFDSPDSIGDTVGRRAESRKRKRDLEVVEEMKFNDGFKMYVLQRDAWTGAESVKKFGTTRRKRAETVSDGRSSMASTELSPVSDASSAAMDIDTHTVAADSTRQPPSGDPATYTTPCVPLARPLLPDNAVRKSISPKTYADIYHKIVVSSRTPSVPINLVDMTRALVQGWQESGEWPPKTGVLDPLAGKRERMAGLRGGHGGEGEFMRHHPHLRKGVMGVRRMLHLNGNGSEEAQETKAGEGK